MDPLEVIRRMYPWQGPPVARDPLFGLIGIVLSQHTNDKNAWTAEMNLERLYGSAADLAKASVTDIANAIRQAGMQHEKAVIIRELASRELLDGLISRSLSMPWKKARDNLRAIKGVGTKTADVFCMIYLNAPVLPIDVHVKRVSQRLGLTKSRNYDEIQADLHKLVPEDKRKATHLSMIRFGREVCKAREPRCRECPLNSVCLWYLSTAKSQAGLP
ncbi:MAG: endonuclease III domain-containing protein [Thermoprotei archaeon]|nr:endonuclease III [TACK group archaeon]